MASSQPAKGRGRGRTAASSTNPPPPSITPLSDISLSTSSDIVDPQPISSTPVLHESASSTPTPTETSTSDTGFSSISSDNQPKSTPMASVSKGRGRGGPTKKIIVPDDPSLKKIPVVEDPYWTVTNLTDAQFNSGNRPKKPNELGTLGEQIQVLANYFPLLQFPHKGLVYKYQIQIRNRKNLEVHRDRRRVIYNSWLRALFRTYPHIDKHKIVFDNQSRIVTYDQQLPDIFENENSQEIMGPSRFNRQEAHTVIVQRVGTPVDLALIQNLDLIFDPENQSNERLEDLQDIKQVLSIALHEHCSSHAAFVYTRSFYAPSADGQSGEWDLGYGKAMWRGFYSCLVFGKGDYKLLMNIDVSHTVFLKQQPFLEFICEIMLHSPSGKRGYAGRKDVQKVKGDDVLRYLDIGSPTYQSDADFLLKHCKNTRVRSQDANKPIIYKIAKLGLPASRQEFPWKTNNGSRTITVANYYKEHYKLDLKYPSLPTLEMGNRAYLPMELVDVEPARVKKITDEQRALLCRYSTVKPLAYCRSIKKIRENPEQQCFEQDPFVRAWNMNIDVEMITVPARVLPMPEIVYTNQYQVKPENVRDVGTWEMPKTTRFHNPATFPKVWGLINLSWLSEDACVEYFHQLSNVAQQRGIDCPLPTTYEECNVEKVRPDEIVTIVERMIRTHDDCRFFQFILPPKTTFASKQAYRNVKKLGELEEYGAGVVTQVVQSTNAVRGTRKDRNTWDFAKLGNILLKINSKLNGVNSILKVPAIIERFFSRGHRIMYVGADLSHPAPGSKNQISVVAVVASADDVPSRYFKEVYKQQRPSEARGESRDYIVSMRDIMKSLIEQYNRHRGYPPTTIIIYRDGISEGEFQSVFEKELTATRHACADLSPAYRPYLTYIVASKRHHTRFFPTGSDKNVPAGTVVDSADITNAVTYDFYLNSHHGALGTSRPTHYYVLYDDNNLKPDEMQMLTYALCYTYARCTRSVSTPAPVKYADLLAFRATYYLDVDDTSDTESVASGPRVPVGQDTAVHNTITSERIVLSSRLDADCSFFL